MATFLNRFIKKFYKGATKKSLVWFMFLYYLHLNKNHIIDSFNRPIENKYFYILILNNQFVCSM